MKKLLKYFFGYDVALPKWEMRRNYMGMHRIKYCWSVRRQEWFVVWEK